MNWSKLQEDIFSEFENIVRSGGGRSLVVSATAGSGKTTTLKHLTTLLPNRVAGNAVFLAFNRAIAREAEEKLQQIGSPVQCRTLNSLGFGVLRNSSSGARWEVDANKYRKIAQAYTDKEYDRKEAFANAANIQRAVTMLTKNLINPSNLDEEDRIYELLDAYNIDSDSPNFLNEIDAVWRVGLEAATANHRHLEDAFQDAPEKTSRVGELILSERRITQRFVSYAYYASKRTISFDDQVVLPVIWDLVRPTYDAMFVDEAQDLAPVLRELVLRSLKPSGVSVFVGDRSQAIYGFAGADTRSIDNIIGALSGRVTELPLSITYRCPRTHVELAVELDPSIQAAPNAREGQVVECDSAQFSREVGSVYSSGSEALVMCRRNAPLIQAAYSLLAEGIPAQIRGREFGASITSVIEKIALTKNGEQKPGFDYEKFDEHLAVWGAKEAEKLARRGAKESAVLALQDRQAALIILWSRSAAQDAGELILEIENLFNDDNSGRIVLSTVHKAKGLETDNAFILEPHKMPLVWRGQTDEEYKQELNIRFVALTRSKENLFLVYPDEGESNDVSF